MPSISVPCSQARLHHMIGGSSLITDHQLLPPALSAIPRLLSNDIYLAYILVKFRLLDLGQNQNDTLAGHRYYLLVATFFFDLCTCCLWVGGLEHLLEYPIISSPNHWVFQAAKKYWEDQRRVSRIVSKNHSWKIKNLTHGELSWRCVDFFCGRLRVHPGRGHDFPEVNHDFTTEEK